MKQTRCQGGPGDLDPLATGEYCKPAVMNWKFSSAIVAAKAVTERKAFSVLNRASLASPLGAALLYLVLIRSSLFR